MAGSDSEKDFYTAAYTGKANNSWTGNPDRNKAVEDAFEVLQLWDVAVIGLGCGTGLHTKWIAEYFNKCRWTGIDMIDAETMKLEVPRNGRFAVADLRTPEGWQHPFLKERYDLVVDQGAVFASITDDQERDDYLARVASLLQPGGIFLALVVEGKRGVMRFPDGRDRMRLSRSDTKEMGLSWMRKFGLCVAKMKTNIYEANTAHNPLNERIRSMHITMIKI